MTGVLKRGVGNLDICTDIYGGKTVKICPWRMPREDGGFGVVPEIAGKRPRRMVL